MDRPLRGGGIGSRQFPTPIFAVPDGSWPFFSTTPLRHDPRIKGRATMGAADNSDDGPSLKYFKLVKFLGKIL